MGKWMKIILFVFIILGGIIFLQYIYNEYSFYKLNKKYDNETLTGADKASLQEFKKLKNLYGNEIWPGFKDEIPVIIFNDKYKFLIDYPEELKTWNKVEKDQFNEEVYYRTKASNPQAFAVNVNGISCGSMSSILYLNKNMLLNIRKELPLLINRLIPYQLLTKSNDFHVAGITHEVFHAYQEKVAPDKFEATRRNYDIERDYPYNNDKLNSFFTQEGEMLSEALNSKDKNEKKELLQKFFNIREKRREKLSPEFILFEKRYEWLEGLAKYVEIKTYEIAGNNSRDLNFEYKKDLPHWKTDFNNLKKLGEFNSEYRFYLSGMAQARLMDQLGFKWKDNIMKKDVYFEEVLRFELL